jgi:XTP/dITP diphosphohydrolase
MDTKQLIFASGNSHKIQEIQHLLGEEYQLQGLKDLNFEGEIPENAGTLEGNALLKARFVYQRWNICCFADDTGLEVECLDGRPGVYSARYSGELSDYNNDESVRTQANKNKLLLNMQNCTNRKARFRTVIAYIENDKEYLFEGIVNGIITESEQGEGGFGYDPLFVPDGYQQSFAEMSLNDKNKISHRAKAVQQFIDWLKSTK